MAWRTLVAAAVLLSAGVAVQGHLRLVHPAPRTDNDYLFSFSEPCNPDADNAMCDKTCGDPYDLATAPVTTLTPGALRVEWEVVIDHFPNAYRISLNRQQSDGGFSEVANVLAGNIPFTRSSLSGQATGLFAWDVVVPDAPECRTHPCVLQVYDLYYFVSCANVLIAPPAVPTSTSATSTSTSTSTTSTSTSTSTSPTTPRASNTTCDEVILESCDGNGGGSLMVINEVCSDGVTTELARFLTPCPAPACGANETLLETSPASLAEGVCCPNLICVDCSSDGNYLETVCQTGLGGTDYVYFLCAGGLAAADGKFNIPCQAPTCPAGLDPFVIHPPSPDSDTCCPLMGCPPPCEAGRTTAEESFCLTSGNGTAVVEFDCNGDELGRSARACPAVACPSGQQPYTLLPADPDLGLCCPETRCSACHENATSLSRACLPDDTQWYLDLELACESGALVEVSRYFQSCANPPVCAFGESLLVAAPADPANGVCCPTLECVGAISTSTEATTTSTEASTSTEAASTSTEDLVTTSEGLATSTGFLPTTEAASVGRDVVLQPIGTQAGWALGQYPAGPVLVSEGDVLVFKYTPSHDVFYFVDRPSWEVCNGRYAVDIGTGADGQGEGLRYPISKWDPENLYFACSYFPMGSFNHCRAGLKVWVKKVPRTTTPAAATTTPPAPSPASTSEVLEPTTEAGGTTSEVLVPTTEAGDLTTEASGTTAESSTSSTEASTTEASTTEAGATTTEFVVPTSEARPVGRDVLMQPIDGTVGWTIGEYPAGPVLVSEGDVLVFKYPPGHDVTYFVDRPSWEVCNGEFAVDIGTSEDGQGEGLRYPISKWDPENLYFACSYFPAFTFSHCHAGQKIWVKVVPRTTTPASTTQDPATTTTENPSTTEAEEEATTEPELDPEVDDGSGSGSGSGSGRMGDDGDGNGDAGEDGSGSGGSGGNGEAPTAMPPNNNAGSDSGDSASGSLDTTRSGSASSASLGLIVIAAVGVILLVALVVGVVLYRRSQEGAYAMGGAADEVPAPPAQDAAAATFEGSQVLLLDSQFGPTRVGGPVTEMEC